MEMHQIRYFLAVCETLNFTRAAEQCHVTQPATRAIHKLEEELGGLLFRRERHLTHMTDPRAADPASARADLASDRRSQDDCQGASSSWRTQP
jgi:DNA-binding transcriptional LysR family regulator